YRGGRYATQPTTGNVSIVPQADYYTYNGTSVITGPFTGTRSFADSVLMDFVLVYGTDTATIKEHVDLDELYDIQDALPINLKAFSYTFDDTDIDLETRIQTACNCARVTAYRQGQKWRFTRDEAKPVTAIFNRRNIAGTSENEMAVSFQKPLDKNGVTIRYVDYTTGKEAYVHRSIGASSFTTDQPSRPLEIDLAGCDNATQAENRADLEVRKLVYQRRTVKERVLMDGLNVAVGDRVKWASIYDGDIFHGECLDIAGSQDQFLYTSEPLWQTGTLYLHYTDTNGDVIGPVQVEGWTNGVVNSSGLAFPGMFTADDDNQAGSYLIVGTTDNLEYSDMTITSVAPREDGTVDIEMIEYNEAIYSED
ncbi:MAG: host specificity factor TipJ family phage tail protein, partial [Thalassolituus sp.]